MLGVYYSLRVQCECKGVPASRWARARTATMQALDFVVVPDKSQEEEDEKDNLMHNMQVCGCSTFPSPSSRSGKAVSKLETVQR